MKRQRYILKKQFEGIPKRSDFDLIEEDLPPLKQDEVLFQALYLSVDPYMRIFLKPGSTMIGTQVSRVVESKNAQVQAGDHYFTNFGWVTHEGIDPKNFTTQGNAWRKPHKITGFDGIDLSHALGGLGMPGLTAWFGLVKLCEPSEGQTLVVTGAAGAVGSIVGQLGKILGLKVIGFAGTDEKVKMIKNEFKFDHAFNYKNNNTIKVLKETAHEGVDCFFDNVGGQMKIDVMNCMKDGGRVCTCGSISGYNDTSGSHSNADTIIQKKKLKVEQFILAKWKDECVKQQAKLIEYHVQGRLVLKQTIIKGFDKLIDAFLGLFSGQNTGKMIVKV